MRNLDLAPLWRTTIGFDRLFDLIDESARWVGENNHPPSITLNGRARITDRTGSRWLHA